jgi:hypothetical protein
MVWKITLIFLKYVYSVGLTLLALLCIRIMDFISLVSHILLFCLILASGTLIFHCINFTYYHVWSWDSSVSIATAMCWMAGVQFPAEREIFLYSIVSRPALGPTQLPTKWYQGPFPPGIEWPGCGADHFHLVPRSRRVELYLHSPYVFILLCLIN